MAENMQDTNLESSVGEGNNTEGSQEKVLPGMSDEQILEMLEQKQNLSLPVKIDGKEEKISLEDLKKGYSHQSAASKRMNEGAELRTTYEKKLADFGTLLRENPEKLIDAYGVDVAKIYKEKEVESQRLEEMDPIEKRMVDMEKKFSDSLSGVDEKFRRLDKETSKMTEDNIQKEFNILSEKYPVMQDSGLQQFAALQMLNKKISSEEAFKEVSEMIKGMVESGKEEYIALKKKDASNQILGATSGVSTHSREIREIKDRDERVKAVLANLDKY